jgi:transglutaminase-like putative cysteine protease
MMRFWPVIFLILWLPVHTRGAGIKYPVSEIPEELKTKMYAVIREQRIQNIIYSKNSSAYTYRLVITILNAKAKNYAWLNVHYDKMTTVKSMKATIYNELGVEIRKLKPGDIEDQSVYDGFSIFNDNRVKTANLTYSNYPYTVEMEYELHNKYLYSLPDFYLYTDDEVSAQQLTYSVIYPKDLKPLYRIFKTPTPEIISLDNGTKEEMRWQFSNVIPEKFEPASPFIHQIVPNISVSPVEFEYGGYAGKMDSWKNYGLWQAALIQGRTDLREETKRRVKELIQQAGTVEEKTRILYEYLQNKTRYVSIQEGIGGMQPFAASLVDEVGYGDCKALSNYMVALLREAGIKGYYTKIKAGDQEPDMKLDFTGHQTNHVIVAVPNNRDTLWLECTNQTNPFGYLGRFTGDRHALMITEEGGKIVKTPTYSAEQNTQTRTADVIVDKTGNAKANIKTIYSGLKYENGNLHFVLGDNRYDDQKKWIQNNTQIPSFDIIAFSMYHKKEKIPSAIVNISLALNRLATVSGKRIFLTPNLMNRSTYIPGKTDNRKNSIVWRTAYIDCDTIRFSLPEDVYPEFVPEPIIIETQFGKYESVFKPDQGSLLYIRKLKINKGEFPPESYSEMVDFYKNINKADNIKMVLINKT